MTSSRLRYRSVILTIQDLTALGWVRAMSRAGLNSVLLHAVRLPQDITELVAFRMSEPGRRFSEACHRAGIQIEYQMHTAGWLVPRALFHKQPEIFRMDLAGQRTSDCNFCLSSDEAWKVFEARAQELAGALPSETGRHLWFGDDVAEGSCHCPGCAGWSPSDQAMIYANRLVRALRQLDPKATVSYLAYHATLSPPEVLPEEGVFLEFAPIQRCYRHALEDRGCAVNRRHLQGLKGLLASLKGIPLHVTEYWLDASRHSGWRRPAVKIPVSTEILQRDVNCYVRLGADSIASYAVFCDEDYWSSWGEPPVQAFGEAMGET